MFLTIVLWSRTLTCHVQYRFEAKTEASHFHWVFLFNAVLQHADALPVFLAEDGVIVGIDRRPLQKATKSIHSVIFCSFGQCDKCSMTLENTYLIENLICFHM